MWLGGPHSWSGHLVRQIHILPLPAMKPQFVRCSAFGFFFFFNNLDWGPVPHFAPWKHCSQCGLFYIPIAFLNVPALAARCLPCPQPVVVPLAAKGGTVGEKWWPNGAWDMHPGFFYMPQICDMGPIILLPFRRKAC